MLEWINSSISVKTLIWMFPFLFMYHELEEIIFIESWLRKNHGALYEAVPAFFKGKIKKFSRITSAQFSVAVAVEFIILTPIVFMAAEFENYFLFLGANGVLLLHTFTHVGQAVFLRRYTPGVVTAVLITFPYSSYLFYRLLLEQIVSWKQILSSIPFGLLVIPIILICHSISVNLTSVEKDRSTIER